MPISPFLTTFFTTLAQVSFTATGLLTVAIAADTKTRHHWFGDQTRRIFAMDQLFLILWPGFISLGGLIPPMSKDAIPSWPLATISISTVYMVILFTSRAVFRQQDAQNEFRKLSFLFSNPIRIFAFFGAMLLAVSALGYLAYVVTPDKALAEECLLSIVLITLLAYAVITAASMLRPMDDVPEPSSNESPPIEMSLSSNIAKSQNTSLPVITFVLAAVSVVLGFLLSGVIQRKSK